MHDFIRRTLEVPRIVISCIVVVLSPSPPGDKMLQSPSAGSAGIGSTLNNGVASASPAAPVTAVTTGEQPVAQMHAQFPTDRANSPHGSEQSRYSAPLHAPYASPSTMVAPLPPTANAAMPPLPMGLPGMPPNMMGAATAYNPPEATQPPPKAYPCSTCGKAFARRSDLARHGECRNVSAMPRLGDRA